MNKNKHKEDEDKIKDLFPVELKNHLLNRKETIDSDTCEDEDGVIYSRKFTKKEYDLYIGAFNHPMSDTNKIRNAIAQDIKHDDKNMLRLHIASGGGSIIEGMQIHNMIEQYFGHNTVTYLDPHGYSMGALAFLMGTVRVVSQNSNIMFHTYSTWDYGKGSEIVDSVNHNDKWIKDFFERIVMNGRCTTCLTQKEYIKMLDGKDYWFNAYEMLERGIATHITIDGEMLSKKQYKKRMKKEKTQKGK